MRNLDNLNHNPGHFSIPEAPGSYWQEYVTDPLTGTDLDTERCPIDPFVPGSVNVNPVFDPIVKVCRPIPNPIITIPSSDVCDTFTQAVTNNVTFLGESYEPLSFIPANYPDCGFLINFDLDFPDVCKDFQVNLGTGSVKVGTSEISSDALSATPRSAPDCGIDLDFNLDIPNFCPTFQIEQNVSFTGPGTDQKTNDWQAMGPGYDGTEAGCGLNIDMEVEICPCKGMPDPPDTYETNAIVILRGGQTQAEETSNVFISKKNGADCDSCTFQIDGSLAMPDYFGGASISLTPTPAECCVQVFKGSSVSSGACTTLADQIATSYVNGLPIPQPLKPTPGSIVVAGSMSFVMTAQSHGAGTQSCSAGLKTIHQNVVMPDAETYDTTWQLVGSTCEPDSNKDCALRLAAGAYAGGGAGTTVHVTPGTVNGVLPGGLIGADYTQSTTLRYVWVLQNLSDANSNLVTSQNMQAGTGGYPASGSFGSDGELPATQIIPVGTFQIVGTNLVVSSAGCGDAYVYAHIMSRSGNQFKFQLAVSRGG